MRRYSLLLASLLVLALAVWGQALRPMTVSPSLPAATATMGISHDTSGTTYISIEAKHLAPAEALQPPKRVYVVWVEPAGQPPQNHGVLQLNDKQVAKYTTTTHATDFTVFVTAENDPEVNQPTGDHLLTGR
ncbi:MAG TPA: hypothetical protein VKT29_09885 [Terriglobales bacterium]|nr:hypothetical protein [Terriglobales bacterium]